MDRFKIVWRVDEPIENLVVSDTELSNRSLDSTDDKKLDPEKQEAGEHPGQTLGESLLF